jgi:hypothetical protein
MEQTRSATWTAAKSLRLRAGEMLDSGKSETEVAEWLARELAAALAAQSTRHSATLDLRA